MSEDATPVGGDAQDDELPEAWMLMTAQSERYHTYGQCRALRSSEGYVKETTKADAEHRERELCSVCEDLGESGARRLGYND